MLFILYNLWHTILYSICLYSFMFISVLLNFNCQLHITQNHWKVSNRNYLDQVGLSACIYIMNVLMVNQCRKTQATMDSTIPQSGAPEQCKRKELAGSKHASVHMSTSCPDFLNNGLEHETVSQISLSSPQLFLSREFITATEIKLE